MIDENIQTNKPSTAHKLTKLQLKHMDNLRFEQQHINYDIKKLYHNLFYLALIQLFPQIPHNQPSFLDL